MPSTPPPSPRPRPCPALRSSRSARTVGDRRSGSPPRPVRPGTVVFAVDHHRGSEENQAGWEHHDPDVVDQRIGRMDTLPLFRRALFEAGLERLRRRRRRRVAGRRRPLGDAESALVFIDGGHGVEPARADYAGWAPKVAAGGTLAIHDVFPDPADGGRPPYEDIYLPAIASGRFALTSTHRVAARPHARVVLTPRATRRGRVRPRRAWRRSRRGRGRAGALTSADVIPVVSIGSST